MIVEKEEKRTYICECGKEFDNPQKFNGHKSHCKIHLEAQGKLDNYTKRQGQFIKAGHSAQIKKKSLKKQAALETWVSEQHTCEKCGKIMTEKYGSGRFCCKSCANSHIKHGKYIKELLQNKSKRKTKTHQEAYAEYLKNPPKCLICGEILTYKQRRRKTCSDECKALYLQNIQLDLVKRGEHTGWASRKQRSYAELFWEKVLDTNNIKYKSEEKILTAKTYYFLDFLIDNKIDLEIDGKQHLERQEHDKLRDQRLKDLGYIVYRVPFINPKYTELINEQIKQVLTFLNQHIN